VEVVSLGALKFDGVRVGADPAAVLQTARVDATLSMVPLSAFRDGPRPLGVFDALFVFRDLAAVDRYQASVEGRKALDSLESQGLVGLAFVHDGMVQLAARKPMAQLDDFHGLKVGIPSLSGPLAAQFRALGANPVNLPLAELASALGNGAVDLAEFTWDEMARAKLAAGAFSAIASNHRYRGYVLVANRKAFDAQSESVKAQLRSEAISAMRAVNAEELQRERQQQGQAVSHSGQPARVIARADYEVLLPKLRSQAWSAPLGADASRLLPQALAVSNPELARAMYGAAAAPPPLAPEPAPAQPPAKQPPQQPAPSPAQPPAKQPPQQPAPAPAQPPAEQPPQQPAPVPAEPPARRPPQQPVPVPAQPPAKQPPQQPAPVPAQPPAKQPPQQPAPVPAQPPARQPPQQPAPAPAQPPAEQAPSPHAPKQQEKNGSGTAGTPTQVLADARWNSWVQLEEDASVVRYLIPGRDYVLKLDLSRHAYANKLSVDASPETKRAIREAIDSHTPSLRLKVRPRLIGEAVVRQEGSLSEYPLQINLDRLREPSEAQAESETTLLERYANDLKNLPMLSTRLGAGSIDVKVSATQVTGCAQIVLSIWDESGLRPLDYLVHTVSVRDPQQAAPQCEQEPLQGGFKSLSGMLTSTGPVQADAALLLIEVPRPDRTDTVALYVDAKRYRSALNDPKAEDPGLYSWQLTPKFSMEDLVGDRHLLLDLIDGARSSGSYKAAANSLFANLFGASDAKSQLQALNAAHSLAELPSTPERSPVVLLRATTAHNSLVYIPLGLLGAHDANLLDIRLTVVQPMSRESYVGSCIDRWTLGIPRTLEKFDRPISLPALPPRMTRAATLGDLKLYFNSSSVIDQFRAPPGAAQPAAEPASAPQKGEALVLVAHQEKGNLWFTGGGTGERLEKGDYVRSFPPGSIAVLAACSAANPKEDNQTLLEMLNRNGIDAVIASPFPIEAPLGVALAQAFVVAAKDAYAANEDPTIRELFDRAITAASTSLGADAPPPDRKLEFIIIGNHELRLCKDRPAGQKGSAP
jgi:TRAP-type C4-dicarboxylate transport system substrate-binding protein